jgi:hypothetical protein
VPKRYQDEDGKSVSSNMRALSLQQGASTLSNKRAAAELASDINFNESDRPNKLRTEHSLGRGPSLRLPPAGSQSSDPQPRIPAAPSHKRPSDLWPSFQADHLGSGLIPYGRLPSTLQSSLNKNNPPLVYPEPEDSASTSPPSSPAFNTGNEEIILLLQPETQPITQEQLVNEVKGIYAGLVMLEEKCVKVPLSVRPHLTHGLLTLFYAGRPETEYDY